MENKKNSIHEFNVGHCIELKTQCKDIAIYIVYSKGSMSQN